jgi:hypothetical protein
MSTRSRIAIALPNGRYKSVYCHWDGYPKGVGRKLVEHYNSEELAKALIDLGGISSLRSTLAPPVGTTHTIDNPLPDVTIAYRRDRGDKDMDAVVSVNFNALTALALNSWGEFIYVFDHGRWTFTAVAWIKGSPLPSESDLKEIAP